MTSPRAGADRCPGLLKPFVAGDGTIIRLRVPGGRVAVATLAEVLALGAEYGAPMVSVTSRGNLQVRGLPDPLPEVVAQRAMATGLLPSATHERVRNILAAPLAGQVQPFVAELDAALCADPVLTGLPGRFLFAVSDASGSVLTEPFDAAYQFRSDTAGVLWLAGPARPGMSGVVGMPCAPGDAVAELLRRARLFLAHRGDARVWNLRDLRADSPVFEGLHALPFALAAPLLPGPIGSDLVVGIPLGVLRATHLAALAAVTEEVVLTPWRSVVVPGGARFAPMLRAVGLTASPTDPWASLSACPGAPWCARTDSPTMDLATASARALPLGGPRVHVVGCERACGAPTLDHVLVLAPHRVEDILTAVGAEPR